MASEKKILISTIQVTLVTLFVKFLGLVKQAVLASYCGATMETDAFFVATGTMVNLTTVLFSALSVSLLTIHTRVLFQDGREKANDLINSVLKTFVPLSACLAALFYFNSVEVAKILAPAYKGEELHLLADYIKPLSSTFLLWCYFLTINVILETDKQFIQGKGQTFFQNIFLIVGASIFYPKHGMKILVYAFLLAGAAQCLLVTWCARDRFRLMLTSKTSNDGVKKLVKVAIPLLLGNAMYEINTIVDGQVATSLGAGGASVLNYGATIHDMVIGVIVASVSTVLFSHFSTWIAKNEIDQVELNLQRILEILTLILLPIMVMCIVTGDQIVEIFYGRGSFGTKEINRTYGVVIGYSLGFIFQAARANLVKVYYAFQDSKRPMINGMIAVALNVVLSITLSRVIGVTGIAAATSISMLFVTILLLKDIKKHLPNFTLKNSAVEILKGGISASITAFSVYFIKCVLNFGTFFSLIIEGIIALLIYTLVLLLLKSTLVKTAWAQIVNKNEKG